MSEEGKREHKGSGNDFSLRTSDGSISKGRMILISLVPIMLVFPAFWGIMSYQSEMELRRELSWLHVDGKYIRDERGQIVFLRGTGLGDLSWQTRWAAERTPGDYQELTQRIEQLPKLTRNRANVIRVAITPNPGVTFPEDEHYPWNATLVDPYLNIWDTEIHPEIYDDQIDALVNLAQANNIYLILEFHGGFTSPGNIERYGGDPVGANSYTSALALDPTPWIDWHLHWVNRYVDTHFVVGFELWNEPWDAAFGYGNRDLGRERYIQMSLQCVEAISNANPKALMILTSAPYGYIHQDFIDLHPLPYNVVYGWHSYYNKWPDYWKQEYAVGDWEKAYNKTLLKLQKDHLGKALEAELPLIATEFGWYAIPQMEPGWDHQMHDYLSILNDWDTNWFVWLWWGESDQLGLANDFHYSELSPQGVIWAQYLWDGIQPPIGSTR